MEKKEKSLNIHKIKKGEIRRKVENEGHNYKKKEGKDSEGE
jgi:hypothetical protein